MHIERAKEGNEFDRWHIFSDSCVAKDHIVVGTCLNGFCWDHQRDVSASELMDTAGQDELFTLRKRSVGIMDSIRFRVC